MPKYILLVDWTDTGVVALRESPARPDKARDMARALGAVIEQIYMIMGDHDVIAVVDAPNDDAMAKFVLRLAAGGSVRTRTLKAFTEDEYRAILGAL
jgi:uncharacterized protein with GYD domain